MITCDDGWAEVKRGKAKFIAIGDPQGVDGIGFYEIGCVLVEPVQKIIKRSFSFAASNFVILYGGIGMRAVTKSAFCNLFPAVITYNACNLAGIDVDIFDFIGTYFGKCIFSGRKGFGRAKTGCLRIFCKSDEGIQRFCG